MNGDDIKKSIQTEIDKVLQKVGVSEVGMSHVQRTQDFAHGDYASNAALVYAKELQKQPFQLAEEIKDSLGSLSSLGIEKIVVASPGYINFYLTRKFFSDSVSNILTASNDWGKIDGLEAGQRVMVEYTQPNPFKPFHIGHLMSNAIGESLTRLIEFAGAEVKRANYQGDIGPHVAKALWGVAKKKANVRSVQALGEAYVFGNDAYEKEEKAKREIDELNKKLYAGDKELEPIYSAGRQTSLDHFEEIYHTLGTKFDYYFFESEIWQMGLDIVWGGLAKGVLEESDGAIIFRGENEGLHTRVFVTSKETPTYEAKDLGLAKKKNETFPFDTSITVTAVEQEEYFKVVFRVAELLLPELSGKLSHVPHGMMQLSSGKMSSRKGNVVTGEALIEEMRQKAGLIMSGRNLGEEAEMVTDAVAVSAIKYAILKQGTGKNIVFNPEQSLSLEGDSGPYLQYAHTRACSVLRKAKEQGVTTGTEAPSEKVNEMERLLHSFPEVVDRAATMREPHFVTTYLTELASAFNSWYAKEQIVDREDKTSPYNVALTKAFKITMKNGLWLLGMQAPERM
jgi:arginyl-tRNA synthetase